MKLGFIGTGAITDAVIRGLINHGSYSEKICVSKRGTSYSASLANTFSQVEVFENNQTLVDQCDCVVLGVLPEQTIELASQLNFCNGHTVVSLASSVTVEALKQTVKTTDEIYRALPMPPVEHGLGPTPVFPASEKLQTLFEKVGIYIPVEKEEHFAVFAAASAFMAPFFETLASNARWMESKGVPQKAAAQYSTSVAHALASLADMAVISDESKLQKLGQECQTAGGLNEQTFNGCKTTGWFDVLPEQFNLLLARLETRA